MMFVSQGLCRLGLLIGALAIAYYAIQRHVYITMSCDSFSSFILARINEPEHECNKAPKWVQNVVMRVLFFMTTIGNAIDAALVPVVEDPELIGLYKKVWIAILFAGLAFYLYFWGSTGNASEMTPVLDGGLRGFAGLIFPYNMKDVFEKGFRKHPNSAFSVHVFPFGKVTVLTSRKLIDEMYRAPPEDLSFDEVSRMLIQPDYTAFGRAPHHHPISVMQQNFNQRLGLLLPDVFDDIKAAVDSALEHTTKGWSSMVVHKFAENVTSKAALRAVVGSPLCKSSEVGDLIYDMVTKATKSAFWINMFPRALHFIVGPLISPAAQQQKRLVKAIIPVVDDRRQKLKELGSNWIDKPDDYLMCLIESAPPGRNYESSYEGIAARLLQFSFASFHTSGNALSHLLFDLAATPSYADTLREEISGIIDYEGLTKQSMQKMCMTDSFMTESARFNPVGISVDRSCSIGLTSSSRYARRSYTFSSQKVVIPKGTVVMASMSSIHRDENIYPKPDTFDPWRFTNLKDQSSEAVKNQYTSITPHYLYFGYGKRACPGRFFANMELKAIFCYIVMNYDLRAEGGVRPPNDELGIGVLPSTTAKIMIRRRF